ncbi:MAG: hypothetical protein IPJ65_33115 [Archangiaceae bacterium]|nr:hypothetical protein [Archangiaceae bacterium]
MERPEEPRAAAGGTAGGSAGGAAGGSAGGLATICDAGFHPVSTPLTGEIAELAVYGEGQLWVVALNGAVQVAQRQPNGTFLPPSGGCTSGYSAAFARSDGRVYLGGAFSGIERLNDAVGTCTAVDSVSTSAAMTGLIGFPAGSGTTELTAVHQDGTIAVRSDPAGTVTGVGPIDHAFAVDGLSSTALHVVGADNGSNKGRVFQGSGTSWSSGFTAPSNERLFAVSLATPSLGYAAGQGSLIRYDGNWNTFTALPVDLTQVRGLLAFPNGDVFAVGTSSKVFKYTASTSRWAPVADFGAGVTVLNKVRGTNECNLWVGGANGFVATTFTP